MSKDAEYDSKINDRKGYLSELAIANNKLAVANSALAIANKKLTIANKKLTIANKKLTIANKELAIVNEELAIANKELAFQNEEKDKRAAELAIANQELTFQNKEKAKRAVELAIANKELAFQSKEKAKRAAELAIVNQDLTFQSKEKAKLAEELNDLAFYDTLTGLPNRRLLIDRLHHALASNVRQGCESAVMFIDLDHFKDINDTLGHEVGDLLLIQTAQRLESCLRKGDTVARLGGDEFMLILENLDENPIEAATKAKAIADKILAELNKPYQLDMHKCHSTVSIGAVFFDHQGNTAEDLIKQADIAMYQAKQAGGNLIRFFNPKMQESINARITLENELRIAIEKSQFHLYYQIQMDSDNRVLGAEALIRWTNPEHGLVLPATFIPIAEETGLILSIGKWVIETACAQIKVWQKKSQTRDLTLAVNVSAKQFRQKDFVDQVQSAVQRHAIPGNLLKLELTESLLQYDTEVTIAMMKALNKIGVQFSLDDFGTGYSSLQYLKRLPLDQFKIDQSFVRDIATDNNDKAIVKAIIAMAQILDIDVIAEGVETEEQQQLLLGKGCTLYQGYLFSKPIPIDQFDALIGRFTDS
ncbi:diguanylate cyclase/phosphodiesterase [Psychromonas ingrahamii 37]|uniref:cyclic-guanylate-specific phosphodiesterase n=1 Tax=Psychromonas ingrahamii (strain DSM 17664 / CCUG 51855 / 37) TaxID=357804 RepID=A1SY75_PSYIN|nr:EAL domain-containing protein [Psychromonas ingrahamii]ABM04440.1 diguanylate cyclase/phosphodiesterase [Psychromonas ingrahamii 37]